MIQEVLAGGRILTEWKSKEEVPPAVWTGNRGFNPDHTDKQWLDKLNRDYYWYWVRADEAKKQKKATYVPGPGSSLAPCAGDRCPRVVPINLDHEGKHVAGSRLCDPCKDFLRGGGTMPYVQMAAAS